MNHHPNTLLLRLEGPLQAWGDNSKFVIRRTMEAPTKSGIIGLVCCAMGLSRQAARERLRDLNALAMGVRVDRPGIRWWDYHTVGAKVGLLTADGKGIKRTASTREIETLITRREYLCDASFLVALQGNEQAIDAVCNALEAPVWPPFLGRKSCPPATPIVAGAGEFADLEAALASQPWRPRLRELDRFPNDGGLPCLIEWRKSPDQSVAPAEAEVWYDAPVSFDPPVHEARLICRTHVNVQVGPPTQQHTPSPPRQRANYQNSAYRTARAARLAADHHLCVFCKSPASTVQHITYRRAGGYESQDDLRSLCRLCHDAVTMIEYGQGMGLDRINPEDPRWRDQIVARRQGIIRFRSLETRRRRLVAEDVE